MPDTILVIVEQQQGKLNRVSWETIAAAQAIAADTGWAVEATVAGNNIAAAAAEVAAKKLAKVYAVDAPQLDRYTPDAFAAALRQLITAKQPKLVLLPHTYQVRDFAPKLATQLGRCVISDCTGYQHNDGKLLFTRQMFQGKFSADVGFASDGPWMATFQNGAFRGDKAEAGSATAPVESFAVNLDAAVRNQPEDW